MLRIQRPWLLSSKSKLCRRSSTLADTSLKSSNSKTFHGDDLACVRILSTIFNFRKIRGAKLPSYIALILILSCSLFYRESLWYLTTLLFCFSDFALVLFLVFGIKFGYERRHEGYFCSEKRISTLIAETRRFRSRHVCQKLTYFRKRCWLDNQTENKMRSPRSSEELRRLCTFIIKRLWSAHTTMHLLYFLK